MFRSIIPIRFSDVDAFGHVNHTNFLTYCEDHRRRHVSPMGRECGSFLLDSGFSIVRINATTCPLYCSLIMRWASAVRLKPSANSNTLCSLRLRVVLLFAITSIAQPTPTS